MLLSCADQWPLRGNLPPIDQLLADSAKAQEWRDAWHQGAADLGVPEAADPAEPLCHSAFSDYPGKSE
jgi:hypothetical protein